MTDRDDDDPATGIPERIERADADARASDSGRHITNRNVVSRGTGLDRGAHDLARRGHDSARMPAADDAFDLITPVRPQPRDVFEDEDATLSHDDDGVAPPGARSLRITPADAGFTPRDQRGPTTDQMPRIERPDAAASWPPASSGSSGRLARVTPDGGFVPPESRRPSSDRLPRLPLTDDEARRPITRRGHVEPPRLPTQPTPPPPLDEQRGPAAAEMVPGAVPSVLVPDPPVLPHAGAAGAASPAAATPDVLVPNPPILPPATAARGDAQRPDAGRPGHAGRGGRAGTQRPLTGRGEPADDPGERVAGRAIEWLSRGFPRPPSGRGDPMAEPSPYDRLDDRSIREPPRPLSGPRAQAYRQAVSIPLDRALRAVAVAVVLGLGAAGLALPTSVLYGGAAWLVFLLFVASGWGAVVLRLARTTDRDVGLRAALGAAGYVAVAGLLVAAGLLTRPIVLALVSFGFAGFTWRELTAPVALWQRIRDGARFVRARPALGALLAALVALACVRMLGAVAALDRDPWDDDLAYTPFVKRLLDVGNLVEPFSFRRLGAYGGQTALQALAGVRGTLANVHLIDKGLGFGVALLALIGHARERRTQPVWLALIMLVVLVLPDTAINTASYWTGLLAFIALYRVVADGHWALAGLVGAVACTLRQSFLAPVVVFIAAALIVRLVALVRTMPVREAWHQERRSWVLAAGVAVAVLIPWWIAAVLSSHTFLFPLIDGNWNHQLSLRSGVTSWPQELSFLLTTSLEPQPIVVIPILALALAFTGDRRQGRPLAALAIASIAGFVLLVHSFLIETAQLWRYAFGFATALAAVLVLEIGADDDRVVLAPLGRWLVLAALVLQLAVGRGAVPRQAIGLFDNVREAAAIDRHGDPNARAEQHRYTAMQAALPEGARVLVMLDDPAMLDYRRNQIANLDTPGFASPGPQLPAFAGAEPVRAYLVAEGYRYAAFVRSERSRYFFRRGFWVQRIFTDAELFGVMSAYTIDAIDVLAELATTTRVLYDDDGLVVLDLATPLREASRRPQRGDEPARRAAWIRELADREGLHDAWSLSTRSDVRFEDGFGSLRYIDGDLDDPKWYEISRAPVSGKRGTAVLALSRRAHLRVLGPASPSEMRLSLRAAIALNTVYAHPRLDISLDGELLASAVADEHGRYSVDVRVARGQLSPGWHDLYLVFASISEPEKDLHDPRVARLESVEWSAP